MIGARRPPIITAPPKRETFPLLAVASAGGRGGGGGGGVAATSIPATKNWPPTISHRDADDASPVQGHNVSRRNDAPSTPQAYHRQVFSGASAYFTPDTYLSLENPICSLGPDMNFYHRKISALVRGNIRSLEGGRRVNAISCHQSIVKKTSEYCLSVRHLALKLETGCNKNQYPLASRAETREVEFGACCRHPFVDSIR